MSIRELATRTIIGAALFGTALASVGLTAPADGPFAIAVRPFFLHTAGSQARALGIDVDLKLGLMHFHAEWSATAVELTSTNQGSGLF